MNYSPKLTPLRPTLTMLTALAAVFCFAHLSRAGSWEDGKEHNRSVLTYSGKASLLGRAADVEVTFNCDTTAEKDVHGTLGVNISVEGTDQLGEFPFSDFEGPDAECSPLVQAVITRTGEPPIEFTEQASGGFTEITTFTFGISELSEKAESPPRALLEALATPGAESLRIVISDPRPSGKSLTLEIPVAGRAKAFRKLLEGLGS